MTNKIINADALLKMANDRQYRYTDSDNVIQYVIEVEMLEQMINELATETQETLDDDWNHDLSLLEDYDEPYLISNGCRIAWGEGFGDNAVYHPIGDFMAFDDEYFRQSVKMWKPS